MKISVWLKRVVSWDSMRRPPFLVFFFGYFGYFFSPVFSLFFSQEVIIWSFLCSMIDAADVDNQIAKLLVEQTLWNT